MPLRDRLSRFVSLCCAVACALAIFLRGAEARAQDKPTLSGAWTASALTESWSVDQWGEACGPKPASQGASGGAVQIKEQGGELSISGAGRSFSTAQCWEQMPGVARSSHSQSGGGRFWRTRCTSGPNDSRRTAITTTIAATDTTLTLNETGDYTFTIQDTTCHASVTRSRSYSLVRRDGDIPPTASASAAPSAGVMPPPPLPAPRTADPKPAARCPPGAAGEPARLEVHPSRKLIRAGEKFTFRALVLDADGCATGTRPAWTIAAGPLASRATIDGAGTLSVQADADEGQLEISVSVGGKGVLVRVDVASAAHYDAMLGVSGLNDAGEADQPAVAVVATGTIGGRTASAQDAARERKVAFVAIAGGLAIVLAFVGLIFVRRGAKPIAAVDEAAEGEDAPASEGPPRGPLEQVPPSAPIAVAPAASRPRGKICPTCGERFSPDATFCGRDGTTLVLIN